MVATPPPTWAVGRKILLRNPPAPGGGGGRGCTAPPFGWFGGPASGLPIANQHPDGATRRKPSDTTLLTRGRGRAAPAPTRPRGPSSPLSSCLWGLPPQTPQISFTACAPIRPRVSVQPPTRIGRTTRPSRLFQVPPPACRPPLVGCCGAGERGVACGAALALASWRFGAFRPSFPASEVPGPSRQRLGGGGRPGAGCPAAGRHLARLLAGPCAGARQMSAGGRQDDLVWDFPTVHPPSAKPAPNGAGAALPGGVFGPAGGPGWRPGPEACRRLWRRPSCLRWSGTRTQPGGCRL